MEVKATVKLTTNELFGFLMHHTYSTTTAFIGIILSIGGYIGFFYMLGAPGANPLFIVALLATGLLFTVIQPLNIYLKAKKQVKNINSVEDDLNYVVNKSGISVVQGEKNGFSTWDEIVKVTSTKKLVMLYTSRVHAYVIPKDDVDDLDVFKRVIQENCYAGYIKLWK